MGLTSTKQISKEIQGLQANGRNLGNPIFDYLFHSMRKFGNHSEFLGCPAKTNLHFINGIDLSDIEIKNLKSYFTNLKISGLKLYIQTPETKPKFDSLINSRNLEMILLGRVPLHLATIENSTLVPLQDGHNISDRMAESIFSKSDSSDLIERITSMIKFGIYEKFLKDLPREIKVVSIVGRQSGGKSYVLNRFFGTRFNVAATIPLWRDAKYI